MRLGNIIGEKLNGIILKVENFEEKPQNKKKYYCCWIYQINIY